MLWSQFLATSQTEMLSLNHDCKKKKGNLTENSNLLTLPNFSNVFSEDTVILMEIIYLQF